MKCENCNQEGFDALITLAGTSKLFADGWCLDCLKKWSYANKHIKLDKPKIEYSCKECRKSLYPQNGVTYTFEIRYKNLQDKPYFLCPDCVYDTINKDHYELRRLEKGEVHISEFFTIRRYFREMHLEALKAVENGKSVEDAVNDVNRKKSLDELFWSRPKA